MSYKAVSLFNPRPPKKTRSENHSHHEGTFVDLINGKIGDKKNQAVKVENIQLQKQQNPV